MSVLVMSTASRTVVPWATLKSFWLIEAVLQRRVNYIRAGKIADKLTMPASGTGLGYEGEEPPKVTPSPCRPDAGLSPAREDRSSVDRRDRPPDSGGGMRHCDV
jgi:hypothetical protein